MRVQYPHDTMAKRSIAATRHTYFALHSSRRFGVLRSAAADSDADDVIAVVAGLSSLLLLSSASCKCEGMHGPRPAKTASDWTGSAAVESAQAGLDPFLTQQVQVLLRLTYVQAVA